MFRGVRIAIVVIAAGMGTAPAFPNESDLIQHCEKVGRFAETAMVARQSNAPLSQLMAVTARSETMSEFASEIVIAAYRRPLFTTEWARAEAVASFRNELELACFSSGSE